MGKIFFIITTILLILSNKPLLSENLTLEDIIKKADIEWINTDNSHTKQEYSYKSADCTIYATQKGTNKKGQKYTELLYIPLKNIPYVSYGLIKINPSDINGPDRLGRYYIDLFGAKYNTSGKWELTRIEENGKTSLNVTRPRHSIFCRNKNDLLRIIDSINTQIGICNK